VGGRGSRLIGAVGGVLVLFLAAGCGSHPQALVAKPGPREFRSQPVSSPSSHSVTSKAAVPVPVPVALIGQAGSYQVSERQLTFTEPAQTGVTGDELAARTLVVNVRYPRAVRSGASGTARGPFPLIMFAPGFQQCDKPYGDLLASWAAAGYVVAAVNFPITNCRMGDAADENDLVNQPGDVSYVLTQLLALSARQDDPLSGLVNRREIAAAGHSDGGDTVAALAANTCCIDHRLVAVAVLSGAEWGPMPGQYFPGGAVPMLFVQGSADDINPPETSVQLYTSDRTGTRYYLDLLGANHTVPYWGTNKVERIVAATTLAFFDRYVLGEDGALATMKRDGNVGSTAELVSGGHLPS
jgi:dienelactone hydrolase